MEKVEWGFVIVMATIMVVCSIFGIRDMLLPEEGFYIISTLERDAVTLGATVLVLLPIAALVGLLDLLYRPIILPCQFRKVFGFRPLGGKFEETWVDARLWALAKEVKDAVTEEVFRQAGWLAKECGFEVLEDHATYLLPVNG